MKKLLNSKFAHRQCLNVGSAGEPIYKIQLIAEQDLVWSSGDILEIQCENNTIDIEVFSSTTAKDDFNDMRCIKKFKNYLPNLAHHFHLLNGLHNLNPKA